MGHRLWRAICEGVGLLRREFGTIMMNLEILFWFNIYRLLRPGKLVKWVARDGRSLGLDKSRSGSVSRFALVSRMKRPSLFP